MVTVLGPRWVVGPVHTPLRPHWRALWQSPLELPLDSALEPREREWDHGYHESISTDQGPTTPQRHRQPAAA